MNVQPRFAALTTAHLADACLRAQVPVRCASLPAVTPAAALCRQAERIRAGVSLRRQVQFGRYLARRQETQALTFREHLRAVGGAIEE